MGFSRQEYWSELPCLPPENLLDPRIKPRSLCLLYWQTCNAGDPGLFPGLGRSTGEGIANPLQYSWTFPFGSVDKEFACNEETWA